MTGVAAVECSPVVRCWVRRLRKEKVAYLVAIVAAVFSDVSCGAGSGPGPSGSVASFFTRSARVSGADPPFVGVFDFDAACRAEAGGVRVRAAAPLQKQSYRVDRDS